MLRGFLLLNIIIFLEIVYTYSKATFLKKVFRLKFLKILDSNIHKEV